MRFIVIADSDANLTWAAGFLRVLPAGTDRELIVLVTPVLPSEPQRIAARAVGSVAPEHLLCLPLQGVLATLRREKPDAVLIALRGPVAAALIRMIAELPLRPVIVTGLPGIAIPATRKTLAFRRQADLFVLHSRREIREFTRLSREQGWTHRFALATLPFAFVEQRIGARGGDLVFAPQALVPRARDDRERLLTILFDAAHADPSRRVVIADRERAGEPPTHHEEAEFPELLEALRVTGTAIPDNLVVSTAPISAALDTAQGLLTVSSTDSIEAIARGIPVIVLDSFWDPDTPTDSLFHGSGLTGDAESAVRREFRHPAPEWLDDNYFHHAAEDDVAVQLQALVAARRQGVLPAREPARRTGGELRTVSDRTRGVGDGDRPAPGAVAIVAGTPTRAIKRLQ